MEDSKVNLWEVMASTPTNGTRPNYANLRLFVVCSTAEQAMEMTRKSHPDCIFHKLERRNSVHNTDSLLVHPETYKMMENK